MSNSLPSVSFVEDIAAISLSADPGALAVLTPAATAELERIISELEKRPALRGVIIAGTPRGFCGGAEIDSIKTVSDRNVGASLAKQGQDIFNRIERLGVPSVAVIHGACFGGALELALACRYRIVSASDSTKLGLPEVKIGIIPGFGGTQRLPRLIGLAPALGMILTGRSVSSREAQRLGLVDEVFTGPTDDQISLFNAGLSSLGRLVTKPRPKRRDLLATLAKIPGVSNLIKLFFRRRILKETKGFYPAPLKAIDVVFNTQGVNSELGYQIEAQALGEMIVTPECKSLINLYDATTAASKLGKAAVSAVREWKIGVVGGGVMGSGLASLFISRGFKVCLVDVDASSLNRAKERVRNYLERRKGLSSGQKLEYFANLSAETNLELLSDCGLVIEAVFEDPKVKGELLKQLSAILPEESLILSNTSSLKLDTLVNAVKNPARFLGMHFFNPPEKMPLVEVVRTSSTGEKDLLTTAAIAVTLGKNPIIVEDVQGFLVNRILTFYLAQAYNLLRNGVSFDEIERTALNFGLPMGPFRLMDEVGLDVAVKASRSMIEAYGSRLHFDTTRLNEAVQAGIKGKKSGTGFYTYKGSSETPNRSFIGSHVEAAPLQMNERDLQKLLIYPMLNEALVCLSEGVAGKPSPEAVWQIDLGSVMGFGFPPFRGGLMFYLNTKGPRLVAEESKKLVDRYSFAKFEYGALTSFSNS